MDTGKDADMDTDTKNSRRRAPLSRRVAHALHAARRSRCWRAEAAAVPWSDGGVDGEAKVARAEEGGDGKSWAVRAEAATAEATQQWGQRR